MNVQSAVPTPEYKHVIYKLLKWEPACSLLNFVPFVNPFVNKPSEYVFQKFWKTEAV